VKREAELGAGMDGDVWRGEGGGAGVDRDVWLALPPSIQVLVTDRDGWIFVLEDLDV